MAATGSAAAIRYSSHTLEGNWAEERSRAPPLRGGVPDFGFREYGTSAAADYGVPMAHPSYRPSAGASRLRFGMVTPDSLNEAAYAYGEGAPAVLRFDASAAGVAARAPSAAEEAAGRVALGSTARDAAAAPTGVSEVAAAAAARTTRDLTHSAWAPPAGGPGSLRVDRGKRSLGISGEVLRIGADPKMSTDAQRTWIGRRDPGITAFREPPPPAPLPTYMSLPIGDSAAGGASSTVKLAAAGAAHGRFAAFAAAPRVVTAITATTGDALKRPGTRIFADEM